MTALPPKPTHNFDPLRFSPPPLVSAHERRAMIELAAYRKSEQRGFMPGHEGSDWLEAEAEVDERLADAQQFTRTSW